MRFKERACIPAFPASLVRHSLRCSGSFLSSVPRRCPVLSRARSGLPDPGSRYRLAGMTIERQRSTTHSAVPPTPRSLPGLSRQSIDRRSGYRGELDPRDKPGDDLGGRREPATPSLVIPDGRQAEPGSGNPGVSEARWPGLGSRSRLSTAFRPG